MPDKWVRKAIYDAVNGIVVGGETINCYDRRAGVDNPKAAVLIMDQQNEVVKDTKCDYRWRHTVLLECYDRQPDTGNAGSRVLVDDVLNAVKDAILNLTLDVGASLTIIGETLTFPGDLTMSNGTEIVNRKFLRVLYFIN